jgi:hypothetical protein
VVTELETIEGSPVEAAVGMEKHEIEATEKAENEAATTTTTEITAEINSTEEKNVAMTVQFETNIVILSFRGRLHVYNFPDESAYDLLQIRWGYDSLYHKKI